MDSDALLAVFHQAVDAVAAALDGVADLRARTGRAGQYALDLAADAAAGAVLDAAGVGVLSEESGLRRPEHPVVVVVDPVDGSTNCSRRIPWYATSLCAVDAAGPLAAVVANLATGERFEAVRGGGARVDGRLLAPAPAKPLAAAVLLVNGYPPAHLGWRQYRALGAAALDLCAVAAGRADAYVDCTADALAPWDYLGAVLVCAEAGAVVADVAGRPLGEVRPGARRTLVAAGSATLHAEVLSARRRFWEHRGAAEEMG